MKMEKISHICAFTFKEKLYAQLTFNAGILIAAYGVFLKSSLLGLLYLLCAYLGILLLIRYTVCPRCPHLIIAGDCVQLHPFLMKKIISPRRKGLLTMSEKILFVSVLYGIFILPLFWIASNTMMLILFLIFYGGHLLGLYWHFCPNCRNKQCIQNRNTITF